MRAIETARAILGNSNVELRTDSRLREFDFGLWEGLTWDEIVERWPQQQVAAFSEAAFYHPPEGESFDDVKRRAASFLDDLQREPVSRVLVATHAGVLHAMLGVLSPRMPPADRPEAIVFAPASLTRVTMDGGRARLITLNDVSHLDSAP